ncbi:hypothetical protein [Rhizobium sp. BK251]|uniref:hypothetical protein n=1 Tax=Rhizobium sp. BK251 TaxID=2512125 RepID=UPI00104D65E4|nr:hypothetical protein [Rhizobium sp. BK251]TCL70469.1 hypothetical protein EV286_107343 [Rhizobium sp. BK251]
MGLLDWLFGKQGTSSEERRAPQSQDELWSISENGNPMMTYRNRRITVFAGNDGWKFCVAKITADNDPYFSEVYASEAAAKYEALAWMNGSPSLHQSFQEQRRENRASKWEECILATETLANDLQAALADHSLNVTALRKIEAKIAPNVKRFSWQITQYYRDGVSDELIHKAEGLEKRFQALALVVDTRIAEAKSRPRKKT